MGLHVHAAKTAPEAEPVKQRTSAHEAHAAEGFFKSRLAFSLATVPTFASGNPDEAAKFSRRNAADKTGPRLSIQAKLMVGSVNDPLEREADRVADQIMRMPEPQSASQPGHAKPAGASRTAHAGGTLQRKCDCGGSCDDCQKKHEDQPVRVQMKATGAGSAQRMEAPWIVHEVLRSSGQPLDSATRAFMEPRFGHDFSNVRIHTDAKAGESAKAVGARAYTVGTSVVFGPGEYGPRETAGQNLLGHELAHVVQQGTTSPAFVRRQVKPQEDKKDEPEKELVNARDFATYESLRRVREQICGGQTLKGMKLTPDSSISQQTAGILDDVLLRAAVCGQLQGYIPTPKQPFRDQRFKLWDHSRYHDNRGTNTLDDRFDADDFHVAVRKYFEELDRPRKDKDKEFTNLGVGAQRDRIAETGGFYDRRTGTLNLPSDAKLGSALHEAIHSVSQRAFQYLFNHELNEGVTQMFADMVLHDEGLPPYTGHTYQKNLDLANQLQCILSGWENIAKVYFKGNADAGRSIADALGLLHDTSQTEAQVRNAIQAKTKTHVPACQ